MLANIGLDGWPKCFYRAASMHDYWWKNRSLFDGVDLFFAVFTLAADFVMKGLLFAFYM